VYAERMQATSQSVVESNEGKKRLPKPPPWWDDNPAASSMIAMQQLASLRSRG